MFKGYYNDILIGSEPFESEIDDFNENIAAGEKKKVNSFQLGVAYFAPPTVLKYGEVKPILSSSEALFSEPPAIILKDEYFSVVDIYNLSLFYGRYGLGRTINTFTLLPGESTEIEITSSRTSSTSNEKKTNVFEKVDSSGPLRQSNWMRLMKKRKQILNIQLLTISDPQMQNQLLHSARD